MSVHAFCRPLGIDVRERRGTRWEVVCPIDRRHVAHIEERSGTFACSRCDVDLSAAEIFRLLLPPEDMEVSKALGLAESFADTHFPHRSQKRGRKSTNEDEQDDGESRLGPVPTYPAGALPFEFEDSTLPNALLGGAALAAAACAVGGKARIVVGPKWSERAILWVPLVSPRGAGKSPAQDLAFGPLRRFDEGDVIPLRASDLTLEALARMLGEQQPAVALDVDELAQLLRGIGEYKRGGGDRGRLLALWSGAPWRYTRVAGAKQGNAVDLRISAPTVVICGGLQPALHPLLGSEEDGLRPRWLPHVAALPDNADLPEDEDPRVSTWDLTIGKLIEKRERERVWRLSSGARETFAARRHAWKVRARSTEETASTAAALIKADVHLARVALILAELRDPGAGGEVSQATLEDAAEILDFTLNCWRALPEQGALTLSFRDGKLDEGVGRMAAWIEEHGGKANRRDLLRCSVAGVRTAKDLDAVLERYEETYPGSVESDVPSGGGRPATIVAAPRRRSP